ncbi:hypothetical protein H634G_08175 [Metarhizium anisopliae BRIP 53293]|uniref:Tyrosinase copper-binding domain-containing protein n=1 Tax=Metarhizium anisopliae BRIP 53293 TaxID=1291518 RepID=A0A0D9NRE3_METAN|nr:hypothetical protein H634G_08175 [Metarhizium anisopliae BRIP 53293]KJK87316.1 hypothetical protein H633G_08830 [Metarhizium anisopliae BRIP 53284]
MSPFAIWILLVASVLAMTLPDKNLQVKKSDARHARLMSELGRRYKRTMLASLTGTCSDKNVVLRKEWHALSAGQRREYIKAVRCLQSKPATPPAGPARTRFEQFVLAHADQSLLIHFSGLLLPWHRYFLSLYEKALRDECGYQGHQPYWDWSRSAADPLNASIFDGTDTSLGSNGKAIPHAGINLTNPVGPPPVSFFLRPAGSGGGCVSGPFENLTLHLDGSNAGASTPLKLRDRPRCLTRDFSWPILDESNSYPRVLDLIINSSDIHSFLSAVEAPDGVHPGGHLFIGGDSLNLFTSPNEPLFYLHHAMLDRVWAIWQSRDWSARQNALDGTLTAQNYPPSANATVDDDMMVGNLGASRRIGEVMSTVGGYLCYVYD